MTEEQVWYAKVAELGCAVCRMPPELHHILNGTMGKKAGYKEVIPLCFKHHSAQTPLPFGHSVHKGTKSFESRYGTQKEMLRWVMLQLGEQVDE